MLHPRGMSLQADQGGFGYLISAPLLEAPEPLPTWTEALAGIRRSVGIPQPAVEHDLAGGA
jgi:hypothetical protein